MARSRVKIDAGQVMAFADKLERTARIADAMRDDWENDWGKKWADEMRARVPVDSGDLRDSIEHVEAGGTAPGGIHFGKAFYWRFLEYGTSKMSPRPFVRPSMKVIRTPARKDAGERAVRLMQQGM